MFFVECISIYIFYDIVEISGVKKIFKDVTQSKIKIMGENLAGVMFRS